MKQHRERPPSPDTLVQASFYTKASPAKAVVRPGAGAGVVRRTSGSTTVSPPTSHSNSNSNSNSHSNSLSNSHSNSNPNSLSPNSMSFPHQGENERKMSAASNFSQASSTMSYASTSLGGSATSYSISSNSGNLNSISSSSGARDRVDSSGYEGMLPRTSLFPRNVVIGNLTNDLVDLSPDLFS